MATVTHITDAEIPEGFKQTEIGVLPGDWNVALLGSIARPKYGKAKPKSEGCIPVIGSGGIYSSSDTYLVDFPTIIVGRKGTAGQVWLTTGPSWPSDTTFYLDWKTEADIEFIFNYLRLNKPSGEHAKTTLPSLQKSDLETFPIPVPPLSEQRAIAHVLSTIQKDIEATDRVIAAAKELKRSLMQHLFTYGPVPVAEAENVTLKDTEIGPVPEHWEMSRIKDVADVKGGKRLPKGHQFSEVATPYPYIRVVDFSDGSVDMSNLKFLSHEDYKVLKRYIINSSDVYISIAGTIGLVGLVPVELDNANLTENAARVVHPESWTRG